MYVGLKSLSEEGFLHMGVIKAPLCNLRIGLARGVLGLEDIHRVADIF